MCIEALENQFPGSVRVRRLEAMLYEAEGSYKKAEDIYNEIIEKDDANMVSLYHVRTLYYLFLYLSLSPCDVAYAGPRLTTRQLANGEYVNGSGE